MTEFFISSTDRQLLFIPTIGIQDYGACRVVAISFLCWSIGIAYYGKD